MSNGVGGREEGVQTLHLTLLVRDVCLPDIRIQCCFPLGLRDVLIRVFALSFFEAFDLTVVNVYKYLKQYVYGITTACMP